MSVEQKPFRCNNCGYLMDALEKLNDPAATPKDGDVCLCLGCAEPHVLHGVTWARITDDELIDMPVDQKKVMTKIQLALRELHRERKKG